MTKSSYFLAVMLTGIAPFAAFGHSYGPAPRVAAAPGDNARACTQCHTTNALNSGTGSVKILLQSGTFYVPGVKQRITVQVSDPAQQRWGFELTARLNSDLEKGQAGDLVPVDNMTQVICDDSAPKPCVSGPQFITHTAVGTRNGTPNGASFQFDWTPPATNAGLVTLYAAGNAANGNGSPTGDQIYTTSVQLTPVVAAAPSVPAGSIVSSATGVAGPIAANSWVTIPDELYANMRGPGENMTVLSTAWSDPANRGTNHDEPILMVLTYGKGRIFHTVMGHDLTALNCVGFIVTYQRGTEWAATGKVTQKAPADFPKADKTSTRAAYNPTDGWVSPPANRAAPAKK